eukprot:9685184-Lingulodinium_polyedra.AAC.1
MAILRTTALATHSCSSSCSARRQNNSKPCKKSSSCFTSAPQPRHAPRKLDSNRQPHAERAFSTRATSQP